MDTPEDENSQYDLTIDADDLSGMQKAAILLISMGAKKASKILQELKEEEIEQLTIIIANMQNVHSRIVKSVHKEYYGMIEANGSIDKGAGYAQSSLTKPIDKEKDDDSVKNPETGQELDDELTNDIEQGMFRFKDIMDLDSYTLQEIIPDLDNQNMAIGLKGVDKKLKQKFINNMSQRAGDFLQEDLDALGPVNVKQVKEAQRKILSRIQELGEEKDEDNK